MEFLENHHVVAGLYPVADVFDGTKHTDIACLKNYNRATFLIICGDSTGGASDGVITISACDDAGGTGAVAMAFKYRTCASSPTVDLWSAIIEADAAGFAMGGADNFMYAIEVTAEEVIAAGQGDTIPHDADWVRLTHTEDTDDPVLGTVICILSEPRYPGAVPKTAIV
ncbi:MAG: hypothetical protein KAV00_17005 [Phycisphaerae bacterium]|nr:hypothetical protein [Phycisphaerae bacterium]